LFRSVIMLKSKEFLAHGLVWLALLVVLFLVNIREHPGHAAIIILLYGALNVIIFYVHYFVITPLLIGAGRYWRAAAYMVVLLVLSLADKYGIGLYYDDIILQFRDSVNQQQVLTPTQYAVGALITGLFFMLLSTAVYVISLNVKSREDRQNLETAKLNAELAFLRSQINPHFLFNSLNNIYSLAYQKSEKTPEAILK